MSTSTSSQISTRHLHISITDTPVPRKVQLADAFILGGIHTARCKSQLNAIHGVQKEVHAQKRAGDGSSPARVHSSYCVEPTSVTFFRPFDLAVRARSRDELDPAEVPAPARLHVDELSRATPTSSTQTGLPRKNSPRPPFQTILVVAASGRCFERGHEERIALLGKLVRIALLGKL